MTTRPIPPVDQMTYMQEHPGDNNQGIVEITPTKHGRIRIEMANCATYPDYREAWQIMQALHKAASKQWPDQWPQAMEVEFNAQY